MPEIISLSAEPRADVGKGAARAIRRAGRVPGIIYGDGEKPMPVSFEPRELTRAINRAGFFATIVDVSVDGAVHRTLARDVQYHPISDAALHIDFMRVGAGAEVRVSVPVSFVNHEQAPGLRRGGILNIVRHSIDIACAVDAIPDRLVVDLDGLEIGDSVHIDAVTMPDGVRPVLTSRDSTIASVAASSAVREEAAAAAAAAATAVPVEEEGAAPAAAAPATPPAGGEGSA
ncbi:MAG: 50S ribosomal protein L25/general stress protein Ctc [Alphaproteobacteria bacterium]|nr:50S ribosomal protein L25/general stress protein Ctc [Alphaproteobacteria bacterium]MBV9554722.1 50S ribosomal protein L25/general stress protein Ctc [Alphaproteobacteria bacterium]